MIALLWYAYISTINKNKTSIVNEKAAKWIKFCSSGGGSFISSCSSSSCCVH